jgi:phosphohistidine phosphatase
MFSFSEDMKLYLVQHGEAKREEEDPSRPLTENGRIEVERVAEFLVRAGVKVDRILHSGRLRAAQTAEILARYLRPSKGVESTEGLEPLADPSIWAEKLREVDEDLMLVGHLPHLTKLVNLLTVGSSELQIVEFRYGGVVCLERKAGGSWSILWIIRPDIIPASSPCPEERS